MITSSRVQASKRPVLSDLTITAIKIVPISLDESIREIQSKNRLLRQEINNERSLDDDKRGVD